MHFERLPCSRRALMSRLTLFNGQFHPAFRPQRITRSVSPIKPKSTHIRTTSRSLRPGTHARPRVTSASPFNCLGGGMCHNHWTKNQSSSPPILQTPSLPTRQLLHQQVILQTVLRPSQLFTMQQFERAMPPTSLPLP